MVARRLLLAAGLLFFVFTNATCCMRILFHACCAHQASAQLTNELLQAIWHQEEADRINELLQQGADPDDLDLESGYTPFAAACEYGNPAIVALFIQHGVTLEKKMPEMTPNRLQPLADTFELPLAASANPRAWTGYTPLQIAAACGHVDCMEILISAGADIRATVEGKTAFELLREYCQTHAMPLSLPNE
ncbi:MAG: ankyrin repeat domain-containing protein [Candidatus Babeliales bacterium]|jgi:hypothetical protein